MRRRCSTPAARSSSKLSLLFSPPTLNHGVLNENRGDAKEVQLQNSKMKSGGLVEKMTFFVKGCGEMEGWVRWDG